MSTAGAKVMRKGTRSCRECRRRKIKCTWTSDVAKVCRECSEHNRQCASQGVINEGSLKKRSNLKLRVGKLESIIERLSQSHPEKALEVISETDSGSPLSGTTSTAERTSNVPSEENLHTIKSPVLDLFDNEVLRRQNAQSSTLETLATMNFDPRMSDREKILSTITDEHNILDVLDVSGDWWLAWEDQYPGAKDLKARLSLRDSVSKQLLDTDPVAVAGGLICIVMSLQYVRVGVDDHDLKLSTTIAQLIERISIAVDQVILSQEIYTNSMAGVQLLILKAKQHSETNQLRKAWLRIRQAIQAAQNIDLAKPLPGMSHIERRGRQRFMGSMFETDRFMSLLLGLPYAVDENFTDLLACESTHDHPDIATSARGLRRITAIASGRVNDRNASSDPTSTAATNNIQETLTSAASSLPLSWWDITSHASNITDPILSHEYLATQLWFYQIQALLQMPFMLKAASDPSFEPSRIICLNSCRSLIIIFNTLRSNPLLSAYTCKCDDFQGLLSAIVLLVGLLHYAAEGKEPAGSTFEADMELIHLTKETFEYARLQQGGNIAKQGIHVLETLSSFLEYSADGSDEPKKASLFVPYFGTISVQAGPVWRPKPLDDTFTDLQIQESGNRAPSDTIQQTAYTDQVIHAAAFESGADHSGPESEQYSREVDQQTEPSTDWDRMLIGPELQQDWNYVTGCFMTAFT